MSGPEGLAEEAFGGCGIACWTWPDDTGHIWEALSPHLSCIHKQLRMKASLEETSCGSIKLVSCKSFKINHARRKMWNCKFPHVSTVMWPSPYQGSLPGVRKAETSFSVGTLVNVCGGLRGDFSLGVGVWVTESVTLAGVPVASVQETLNVHDNYLQDE
jgi:hypothetical protein